MIGTGSGVKGRALRVLITTRLFPNRCQPHAASFNRQQFAALSRLCHLETLAVIPWFPGARWFSRWSMAGRLVDVPREDSRDGLKVRHPRVLYIPRIGDRWAPALYAASLAPLVSQLRGQVDVVLGSWAFPDGVAAIRLGRWLGVPVVVKMHGSDMNAIARRPQARRLLAEALPRASRVVAVSRALVNEAEALGVSRERLVLVPNGVDRALFSPKNRAQTRSGLAGPAVTKWILFVGHLDRSKGVLDLLDAFEIISATTNDAGLILLGAGPLEPDVRAAAERHPGRIVVPGSCSLAVVARWMTACDVFTLPSWSEGMPNVVLEAMASGRRVVATTVGGIPDAIDRPFLGELVPPRAPALLADALLRVLGSREDPDAIAAAAPGDWHESAARLATVLGAAS